MNRFALALGVVSVGAACSIACSSIPDVQFVDDALLDSGTSVTDANTATPTDARATSDARTGSDGSTSATCPGSVPSNATTCCGKVACSGSCGDLCSECLAKCDSDEICCAKKNVVVCRPKSSSAPCD